MNIKDIQIFNNPEFEQIRTVVIDGEPWFVGRDIALNLGYSKPQNALKDNVEKGDARKWGIPDSNNHIQQMVIVNEAGMYSLIFNSKLETAKKFKHWVTSEVLPQLRKTGSYVMPQAMPPSEIPLGELASYLKIMDKVAARQSLPAHKIAQNFKRVSEQFGICHTPDFVEVPEYEQCVMRDGKEKKRKKRFRFFIFWVLTFCSYGIIFIVATKRKEGK